MSLINRVVKEVLFEPEVLDDHFAQIGQVCLYIPARRCSCVDVLTWDPDPDCTLCNGTAVLEFAYSDLVDADYRQPGIKRGALGEIIDRRIGLELLDNTRMRIEGPFQVTGEAMTSLGSNEFEGSDAGKIVNGPIKPHSVVVTGGNGTISTDDGCGIMRGAATGTVDYTTREINLTFRDTETTATVAYIYQKVFTFDVDFELVVVAGDDRGAVHIDWIGDEPIDNEEYEIYYTMKRESVCGITGNIFHAKLSQFEAGLWQDGDVKFTPPATERNTLTIPWTRQKTHVYDMGHQERIVLWNSRGIQQEQLEVPSGDVLDLKWRFVVEVMNVVRLNDAKTALITITPTSVDLLAGTVTLPAGHEGKVVTVRYKYRPMYQAYHENPMARAHELGKQLPKYLLLRPIDMLDRGDKQLL